MFLFEVEYGLLDGGKLFYDSSDAISCFYLKSGIDFSLSTAMDHTGRQQKKQQLRHYHFLVNCGVDISLVQGSPLVGHGSTSGTFTFKFILMYVYLGFT